MSRKKETTKKSGNIKPWYSLEVQDILYVADDMEIKLSKAEIKKVKELAPDYIDWFSAIENAISAIKQEEMKE